MIKRRQAVSSILSDRADGIAVAGLGSPVYDVYAAGDHPLNFYNWGAMGSAVMVGLGLALAQPKRTVIVFTGDGEMLMGLGSLCTVAQHKPSNLHIVVLDNEQYAETGMQKTATGFGTDLSAVAAAVGFEHVRTLRDQNDIEDLQKSIQTSAIMLALPSTNSWMVSSVTAVSKPTNNICIRKRYGLILSNE